MPQWVLLVSDDSVGAVRLEQEIRLAGFSPRRAPDLPRAEVLIGQGERPAAVVVDLGPSAGSYGLAALDALRGSGDAPSLVAVTPDAEGPIARRADEAGAHVLDAEGAANGALSALLGTLLGRGT